MSLELPEDPIVRSSFIGTGVFTVVAAVAAATNADPIVVLAVIVDLVLFVAGCAAFVATLLRAADRSRTENVTIAGIWWLEGTAPNVVRHQLLGALGVQIVVALGTAFALRDLAFGILVPTYGLGLVGLWGARLGSFGPRV